MNGFESASLNSIERLDRKLLDQVKEKLGIEELKPEALNRTRVESVLESVGGGAARGGFESMARRRTERPEIGRAQLEAIVLAIVRPPLLVRSGTFVPPLPEDTVPEVMAIVAGLKRAMIDPAIARTARVELANVPGVPYVGTGWIVDKPGDTRAILVTNRHVAQEFARADGRGGYYFRTLPNFRDYETRVDFLEEHDNSGSKEAPVLRVAFIAGDDAPDIALLEAEGEVLSGLEPMEFQAARLEPGAPLGVVGYPAYDSRSDPQDVADYFGNIFDVKRFSFGNVTSVPGSVPEFTHDATTLGGNSGSCVFDRETGKAVGLHFAGDYRVANYAVPGAEVLAALRGLKTQSVVPSRAHTEARGDGRHKASSFSGRDGYNPAFLGRARAVKPPQPGQQWKDDLTEVEDPDNGGMSKELKYRHFSVWMCRSRKLPLVTAVNIDGTKSKRMGRVDKWYIDGRLGDDFQVDNAAYAKNPLDRGHMVRREDPVWGSVKVAKEANVDTFHYTNAAPQHEDLNQRDWVGLEDYVLGTARTRGLKVSVFTGPVLGDNDRDYKGIVRLPVSFWKIAAIVNDETGKLSVTGYVLAQGDLIKGLTGEFVYGAFGTYQVEVARIGELARLDVAHLAKHDPFAKKRRKEGLEGNRGSFRAINGTEDLVI